MEGFSGNAHKTQVLRAFTCRHSKFAWDDAVLLRSGAIAVITGLTDGVGRYSTQIIIQLTCGCLAGRSAVITGLTGSSGRYSTQIIIELTCGCLAGHSAVITGLTDGSGCYSTQIIIELTCGCLAGYSAVITGLTGGTGLFSGNDHKTHRLKGLSHAVSLILLGMTKGHRSGIRAAKNEEKKSFNNKMTEQPPLIIINVFMHC